jgi:FAD dependent oxidoreductase
VPDITTSALGWTDLGSDAILGGLSRDFHTRIYQHYQKAGAWNWEERSKFANKGQGPPALNPKTQLASVFEPSVATAVFKDMLKEHGVTVVTARLDLKNGVVMDGKDWNWTTLNHDERLALAKKHEHWQRGLLWTLQNHPRVPANIRKEYSKWGLPKDEFTDNDHWPRQLYIREAHRMVSDFVMNEHHCTRRKPVPESSGLAAYTMNSHAVRRYVKDGMVKNEGDVRKTPACRWPEVDYRKGEMNRPG